MCRPPTAATDSGRAFVPVVRAWRDENAGRVELMAAQLGHQAAAGAVPQPPADQFLERRTRFRRSAACHVLVAVVGRLDVLIFDLGLHLGQHVFVALSDSPQA